jgi:hypothetical protein
MCSESTSSTATRNDHRLVRSVDASGAGMTGSICGTTSEPRVQEPHLQSVQSFQKSIRIIRTGTVLWAARGLLTAAVLFAPAGRGDALEPAVANGMVRAVGVTLPGAIGAPWRPQPGPRPESSLPDAVQPVEIRGPAGLLVAIETAEGWSPLRSGPLRMGLVVGQPYRLRLAGIPGRDGEELFPSIRVLAKLATPPGMAWRFPVEVVIDEDDLSRALGGAHVRRVVYTACDPDVPDIVPEGWFDVRPGCDCLEVASTLGDPVAELIIGNRVPDQFATSVPAGSSP